VGSKWGGESTRSMARWPLIVCATYFAAAGPLFLWPPVAFFPPLPLAFVTRSSTSAALRLQVVVVVVVTVVVVGFHATATSFDRLLVRVRRLPFA